jgi:hypothetical protein
MVTVRGDCRCHRRSQNAKSGLMMLVLSNGRYW